MEGTALGSDPTSGGLIARTAVAALAGGTASVLSGGKFANGAITGAMGHLFNYEASNAEHLRCKGQCHGYAGEPGRPMTSGEEKGLHALTFAATIGNPLAALRSMLSGSVTLYRAVSVAELEQLITTGVFKAGSNSGGFGKHFASTAEDAASWGNAMDGPNNFHVVAVEFPKGLPKVEQYWNRLDGIGPAYHIELGPLNAAKPNISQVRVPAP